MEFINSTQQSIIKAHIRSNEWNVRESKKSQDEWDENMTRGSISLTQPTNHKKNKKTKDALPTFERKYNAFFKNPENTKAQLLNILPIGLNNLCHGNVINAIENLGEKDWAHAIGHNILFCGCGRFVIAEIHSVLYHKPTKTYVDITPDFDRHKAKYFIPIISCITPLERAFYVKGRMIDYIVMGEYKHFCMDDKRNKKRVDFPEEKIYKNIDTLCDTTKLYEEGMENIKGEFELSEIMKTLNMDEVMVFGEEGLEKFVESDEDEDEDEVETGLW
jgi:hypothetical protein